MKLKQMWKIPEVKRMSRQPFPVQSMIDQRHQENAEYFKCWDGSIFSGAVIDLLCLWGTCWFLQLATLRIENKLFLKIKEAFACLEFTYENVTFATTDNGGNARFKWLKEWHSRKNDEEVATIVLEIRWCLTALFNKKHYAATFPPPRWNQLGTQWFEEWTVFNFTVWITARFNIFLNKVFWKYGGISCFWALK